MRKRVVREVEYLQAVVNRVIEDYREGTISNPAEAQAKINEEIHYVLTQRRGRVFHDVLWLRVAATTEQWNLAPLKFLPESDVLSTRKLGGRQGQDAVYDEESNMTAPSHPTIPDVYYITLRRFNPARTRHLIQVLETNGFEVRNWTLGCHRR